MESPNNRFFNLTNIDKSKKEKITETSKIDLKISKKKETEKKSTKSSSNKKETDMLNVVKDVEYLTADKNGNKYKILAKSGRTNQNDKNILDLNNVRGEITSNERSTIYIVSDFAKYNSSTLISFEYFACAFCIVSNKELISPVNIVGDIVPLYFV